MKRPVRYLEIGLSRGITFEQVLADSSVGIDPKPRFFEATASNSMTIYRETSDTFFSRPDNSTFDLVFIDGLHLVENVFRDLVSSLEILSPGGVIVIDDTSYTGGLANSRSQFGTGRPRGSAWYGDTYLVLKAVETLLSGIDYSTIEYFGHSQTLLWKTGQELQVKTKEVDPTSLKASADTEGIQFKRRELLEAISVAVKEAH